MVKGSDFRTVFPQGYITTPSEMRRNRLALGIDGVFKGVRGEFAGEPAFERFARMLRRATVADIERIMVPDSEQDRGAKYLRFDSTLARHVGHVRLLGLDRAQPESILDLGGGAGFFGFAARTYGHRVVVLEPEAHLLAGLVLDPTYRWLGVAATRQGIYRQTPLAADAVLTGGTGALRRFDRITSWATMWNYWSPSGGSYWDADDYRFLFLDFRRFLRRGAPFNIQFNGFLFGGSLRTATPSIEAYYRSLGAWLRPLVSAHDEGTYMTTLDIWRDMPAPVQLSMPLAEDITPERVQERYEAARLLQKQEQRAARMAARIQARAARATAE